MAMDYTTLDYRVEDRVTMAVELVMPSGARKRPARFTSTVSTDMPDFVAGWLNEK